MLLKRRLVVSSCTIILQLHLSQYRQLICRRERLYAVRLTTTCDAADRVAHPLEQGALKVTRR